MLLVSGSRTVIIYTFRSSCVEKSAEFKKLKIALITLAIRETVEHSELEWHSGDLHLAVDIKDNAIRRTVLTLPVTAYT